MVSDQKSETFMVRMSADEREMLRTLAAQAGESDAAIVRRLIRAAYSASETRTPKKKR